MRYLAIILFCEVMALVLLMAGNPAIDAIANNLGSGLTGFAAIGHSMAITLCALLALFEAIRTIRSN